MIDLSESRFRLTDVLSLEAAMRSTLALTIFWVISPVLALAIILKASGLGWLLAIPATFWLAIYTHQLISMLRADPPGRVVQNFILTWASEHSAWINEEVGEVEFGFYALGIRFIQHRAPLDAITDIHHGPGAGSIETRTDFGDWSTSVWYTSAEGEKTLAWTGPRSTEPDALAQADALKTLLSAHSSNEIVCSSRPEGPEYRYARYS